ncbi:adenylyl cyclase-associated protein 1-like [Apostichopus japonicus]|uniref:adenylyl cyclase-associated protein 1-like n=1 Tax=Stichopus japonicus TaxID=307972 RepID=UPI003AB64955
MANLADLISQLDKLSVDLRTCADNTKSSDVPQDSGEKLEQLIIKLQGIKGDVGGAQAVFVQEYQSLLADSLASFVALSNEIGGEVQEQVAIFKKAFDAQGKFIVVASESKPPSQAVLMKLLQPTSEAIAGVQEFREKRRTSAVFNHLSALSETIPALGWVTIEPKPGPFVKEMSDAGQFYSNRVLKDFKDKDVKHVNWVKALLKLFKDLHAYVLKYHTTGLVWNKQGKEAQASDVPAAAAPAAPAGGAPPPPPPPPADLHAQSSAPAPAAGGDERNALFAELNKGSDITKGLKKVTSDMQTHKNPNLRQGPKPFGAPKPFKATSVSKPTPASAPVAAKAKKEPKLALVDKKWMVEHFDNNPAVEVNVTHMKQSVYVFKCSNSVIQVKGKVNSVILDNCKKVGLVMESAVSAVDIINSQSIKLQMTDKVPIVNIDKTDGAMVYLSANSLNTEFVTAKSSEMNILVPQADGEFKEFAVPEQFRTSWDGKKLQTECAEVVG